MPQALLPNAYPPGPVYDAYERCLRLEALEIPIPSTGYHPSSLLCARWLGHLLCELPTDEGRDSLSREINGCDNDAELTTLAGWYIDGFLRPFKLPKGPTPPPSDHSSSSSSDAQEVSYNLLLERGSLDHRSSKNAALRRDCHHCILSGSYDIPSLNDDPSVLAQYRQLPPHVPVCFTKAVHIIPDLANSALFEGNEEINDNGHYTTSFWAVLGRFGHPEVRSQLSGNNVHRLENIMTLKHDMLILFNDLRLWLEATSIPNQYILRFTSDPGTQLMALDLPNVVTFVTADASLPLPSPLYLRLHATCAKVADLSGAGAHLHQLMQLVEDTRFLANDGSSGPALAYALSMLEGPRTTTRGGTR